MLLLLAFRISACQQPQCPACADPERVEIPITVVVTATESTQSGALALASTATTAPTATPTRPPPATATRPLATQAAAGNDATPTMPSYLPGPNAFYERFEGDPASPDAWRSPNWDVTIHSRDWGTWIEPVPMSGDHGLDCGAPPATHPILTYEQAVYSCRDHLMTAINGPGYAMIYLTPDHLVDFSEQSAIIRWEMSTFRHSQRDWVDVWITPFASNNQLTLLTWLPDLNGPAADAVHVELQDIVNTFTVGIVRDFNDTRLRGSLSHHGYDLFLEPSQRRRDLFEIQLSRDHIRVGMPDYDFWWVDDPIEPPLTWSSGVVQFGHHSYNPTKSCDHDGSCGPTTWHWDNVIIDPARPFTMIPADRVYLDEPAGQAVTFTRPAPAGAHLRFTGFAETIEISYDDGLTWLPAQRQRQLESHTDRFQAYWMPLPAGTQHVLFRGAPDWPGGWFLKDFAIWSEEG